MPKELYELIKNCVEDISGRIVKSNDATDKKSNYLFKPLVLLAQNACDTILADQEKSVLERIMLCADKVNGYGAGNCMLQSFVALSQMIKVLLENKLITMESTYPIAICTTKNHTFLMIDGLVCDPWAKYHGPFAESPYARKKVGYYFAIDAAWRCYDEIGGELVPDHPSTDYTFSLVKQFAPVPPTSMDIAEDSTDSTPSLTS